MNTKTEILPPTPNGVVRGPESKEIIMKCLHCGGSIIEKYDSIYCIQCSREPKQTHPTISDEEYEASKRGDHSITQRINRVAVERGRSAMRWSR